MEKMEKYDNGTADRSPSPGILALVYFLVFAAGMIINMTGTAGASYPTPYDPVQKAQAYYQQFHAVTQLHSFFIFWSAIPLGIYTAFFTSRLSGLTKHRGGLNIATFGGFGAAIFIALSGLCSWVLSQPFVTDAPEATRIMQLLTFTTGGTGNVVFSGLLIAGISVTAGISKNLPKWIMWSGLVLALISILSMLNMIFPGASVLLPIGRFLGMIWMIVAGFKVKKRVYTGN
jgi:hypothetical protein